MSKVLVEFVRDVRHGGDAAQPGRVGSLLAGFVGAAKTTLDIAIYDFRLDPPLDVVVVDALTAAVGRGVAVRVAYDAGKPSSQTTVGFAAAGADPAPVGTAQWLRDHFDGTPVQLRAISTSGGHLMHDKYIVRDVTTSKAAVWTGSANWTNDAWTLQENNIVQVTSRKVAAGYATDFNEMWDTGAIRATGADADGHTTVDGHAVEWAFGPGDGAAIDAHLVSVIAAATHDIALATMVLTSATILGALHDALDRGVTVHGIFDSGQMNPIVAEWKTTTNGTAKAALFQTIATHLHHKKSAPYTPTSKHDFMHHKLLIVDQRVVVAGSHNFSANATGNAENSFTLHDPNIVEQYAAHVAQLEATY